MFTNPYPSNPLAGRARHRRQRQIRCLARLIQAKVATHERSENADDAEACLDLAEDLSLYARLLANAVLGN